MLGMKSKDRCRHIHCCCHCQSDSGNQEMDVAKTRRRIEDVLRKQASQWQLAKIAELLGVGVAHTGLPETDVYKYARPYHGPNQVRCLCQIKVGLTYKDVHKGSYGRSMKITKAPFQRPDGSWWSEVEVEFESGTYTGTISHSDMSIVPEHDRWNAWNWLAFTDDSRHLAYHHCCCH